MIFWVLRFLWKLFVSIQLRWAHFLARCENSFEYFFPATGDDIATKARPLFQKPVHLAILVEDITGLEVQCLARMVSWSYAAGIYDVTLFDGDGYLKTHRSEVFDLVEQEAAKFLKQQPHLSDGITHSFLTIVPSPMELLLEAKKSGKLGSTNKSKFLGDGELLVAKEQNSKQSYRLRLTSLEDGKERILQTVKNLASRVRDGDFELTQIAGFTFMNDILMENCIMDSPDFVLSFGSDFQKGFLPWETRYSEIMKMGDLADLSFRKFWSSILFYNDCKKRFGK